MKLFFRRFGQGFPVIILHGLFGLSDNWVTFGRSLSEQFEVFIPDLRNHGQSPHSQVFDFPALVEDLGEFLENNNIIAPVLIGHSLGGKTAMLFALEFPELIKKLIVVDISLRKYPPNGEHQQLINAMLAVDFSSAGSRMDVERQLEKAVESKVLRQFLLKNVYWRNKTMLDWRLNLPALNENLPLVFEGVTSDRQFDKPVLFIRGERSPYITDSDHLEIYKKFPQAVITTIPNASHWVHADAPVEFFRLVDAFLQ